ncbi:hypothetical protein [Halalkalicoccus salilacus]|uniref:hypothetical protein n=1 Tax=Halalkalicoccus salilacus TaxID=3117459 RepID=UPI00300E87E8
MRRRQLWKTCVAGLVIPLGGCADRLDPRPSNEVDTPERVAGAEFEFSDGRDERSQDDPSIEVDAEEESATVTGTLRVGSGSCNEATLDEIAYDDDSGTVTVVVTWVDTSDEGEVCTDDISSDEYEVRLEFKSRPSAITAVERDYLDEEYTATKKIDVK